MGYFTQINMRKISVMTLVISIILSNFLMEVKNSIAQSMPSFIRISSGKIAYDTFNNLNGTATDIPWTIVEDIYRVGLWSVENGMFKSETTPGYNVAAYPTNVKVTDCVLEVKVKPMVLKSEGPQPSFCFDVIDHRYLAFYFDCKKNSLTVGYSGVPIKSVEFTMNTGVWSTLKVEVFGSRIKCYVNEILKLDVVDSRIGEAPPRLIFLTGYYDGEWGYWDDFKVWRSNNIVINGLRPMQRVELYDKNNNFRASGTVEKGETKAILDVSHLNFPFKGYFKIYSIDGVTVLLTTELFDDIWGGDEYLFLYALEIDSIATFHKVVDEDSFECFPCGRIKLADIDTPEFGESGYEEAKIALEVLLSDKKVFLDVDNVKVVDQYNRLVCLVYVRHNSTHLLNVNKWLVNKGYAEVRDYPNEFDPSNWSLYVYFPISEIPETYNELVSNYLVLMNKYNELLDEQRKLQTDHETLLRVYFSLNESFKTLTLKYENLTFSYENLKTKYSNLSNAYSDLEESYEDLSSKFSKLEADFRSMEKELEITRPFLGISLVSTFLLAFILLHRSRTWRKTEYSRFNQLENILKLKGRIKIEELAENLQVDRTIVQSMIFKLIQQGKIKGSFTSDGKEFVTEERLKEELRGELKRES